MEPYYQDEWITLYNGDALEIAPALAAGAVISDPPYGMAWNTNMKRFTGGSDRSVNRRGSGGRDDWGEVHGDDRAFDPTPWLGYDEVILFGANHFAAKLPVGSTLIWIKKLDGAFGTFLSDAEIAWMSGGHGVYCFRDVGYKSESREHPTQKPIKLMRWCVEKTKADVILDPFAGSGTTLRAAKDLSRRAIGIEIEEKYCEVAARRLAQEVMNFDIPADPNPTETGK